MNSAVRTTKPIVQALLIADHVYVDRGTGKCVIAGVFTRVVTQKQPKPSDHPLPPKSKDGEGQFRQLHEVMEAGSPFAYINLTDMRGKAELELRYVYLPEDKVLFECPLSVESSDPLAIREVVIPLPKLPIVSLGSYALELLCEQEILGSVRITVVEGKVKNNDND